MESDADELPAKRRKLRKGTHSCLECRRRKVKCIYATAEDTTCIVCMRRGTRCTSQGDARGPDEGMEKTGPVDATVHASEGLLNEGPKASRVHSTRRDESRAPPSSFLTPAASELPLGRDAPSYRSDDDSERALPQAHATIRKALLHSLPCETDMNILSGRISLVSAVCYQADYKSHGAASEKVPKEQIPVTSLLYPENHPTLLARQMLLYAAAIQHLSPTEVVPGLTEHPQAIMRGLAESAIKLVNMDDALLGSLEALENLIFEIFYHVDCGNIRRAWITTRRAVTAAQMLGLHRPGQYRFILLKDDSDLEPEIMWSTIVSMERMLSLLLGLPTGTGHTSLPFQIVTSVSAVGYNLSALVGSVAGRILERNQADSAQQALEVTGEIDREIISAAEQMPSEFWQPLAFKELERDSLEALSETRRAFGHMCYYSLVVQLHLPYMLSPHDPSQRMYSKIACVNASREVLNREIEMRMFNRVSACCRMSDFLALIAGMALILGHATSHCGSGGDRLLGHQRMADRAIVQRALDCIDPMSGLHGDVLALRCAALLRDLLAIEDAAARQHSLRGRQHHETKKDQDSQRTFMIMRVPYLGSIQISQEGVAALPTTRKEQAPSLSEGVTIGGIGSMHIGQPQASDGVRDQGNADTAVPSMDPTATTCASGQQHSAAYHAPVIPAAPLIGSDLMFPDTAATFDDWAFQGVDTAFMETLMLGSTVPLLDNDGDVTWDLSTFP